MRLARCLYGTKPNTPDLVVRGGATYRLVSDQLGSPVLAINVANSSDVPFQSTYSAWGERTLVAGIDDWMPFGFAGGCYDPDTKLTWFGRRDYEALYGRWLSKDPSRFDGGPNLLLYANGDPVNSFDQNGETAGVLPWLGGLLGAAGEFLGAAAAGLAGAAACLLMTSDTSRPDCDQQWNDAYKKCAELITSKQTPEVKNLRGSRGGQPYGVDDCARGFELDLELTRVERLSGVGRHTEVVALLTDLISEHPGRFEPYFRRAMSRDALRDRVGALADLTEAIAINPAEPALFYFRGRWRIEDRDYVHGISDLRQAITADEAQGSSYYAGSARLCLAVAHFLAKQFKQCELVSRGISTDATTYLAGRLWRVSDLLR